MQEKAQKEANKLQKNFKKIQKKADKNNERDRKMLDKELEKMGISSSEDGERGNQTESLGLYVSSHTFCSFDLSILFYFLVYVCKLF